MRYNTPVHYNKIVGGWAILKVSKEKIMQFCERDTIDIHFSRYKNETIQNGNKPKKKKKERARETCKSKMCAREYLHAFYECPFTG